MGKHELGWYGARGGLVAQRRVEARRDGRNSKGPPDDGDDGGHVRFDRLPGHEVVAARAHDNLEAFEHVPVPSRREGVLDVPSEQ